MGMLHYGTGGQTLIQPIFQAHVVTMLYPQKLSWGRDGSWACCPVGAHLAPSAILDEIHVSN